MRRTGKIQRWTQWASVGLASVCLVMPAVASAARQQVANDSLVTHFGSTGTDSVYHMATDSNGNIYATGVFSGTIDFDPSGATDNRVSNGSYDIFVTKFNADHSYGYTRSFGAGSSEYPTNIKVDSHDNVFVTGSVSGNTDFDPDGAGDSKTVTGIDGFVTKINADGSYGYTYMFAGSGNEYVTDVAIDSADNIITVGQFDGSIDTDPTGGTDSASVVGSIDTFLSKISNAGSYLYGLTTGSSNIESFQAVAVDSNDDIYVGGMFTGALDFDPTGGTDTINVAGGFDGFWSKYTAAGNYGFTKTFGDTGLNDRVLKILVSPYSDVVNIGGYFNGTVDMDTSTAAGSLTAQSTFSTVVAQYTSAGDFKFARQLPSNNIANTSLGMTLSQNNEIAIFNYFTGTQDFNYGGDYEDVRTTAGGDAYLSIIGSTGDYQGTVSFGGTSYTNGLAVAYTGADQLVVGGDWLGTTDFDLSGGTNNLVSQGSNDGYILAISLDRYYTAAGLPSGFALRTVNGDVDLTDNLSGGIIAGQSTATRLYQDGKPLVLMNLFLGGDPDWSAVTGGRDAAAGTAFVHNLTLSQGYLTNFSLYVPKLAGHQAVRICPNADSLTAVSAGCAGGYIVSNGDNRLATVTIDGQDYWLVSGLTGTGGMSLASAPATGLQAGTSWTSAVLIAGGLVLVFRRFWRRLL